MKKSVRNLMIATGIVALGGFVISKVVNSKKRCIVNKGDTESLTNNETNGNETIQQEENTRKYHTIHVYKKVL